MIRLFIHPDASKDIERLWSLDGPVADDLVVLLEALSHNQDLLDRLTQHGFGTRGVHDFHVSSWIDQERRGRNLWRLRVWSVPSYRVIYAFVPRRFHYYVLGVMPRSVDYDRKDPFVARIERAYDELAYG
ncbi:hypothetical protein FIV34_08205 [Luteibacter pinisoli]|uniref:Type II toxin-antitoxin system RelE/ParE family toxin n=1 Tax=Luteibacter pinisoli TaxID=2589080 RepID=A0A4Y5Z446_9GAMM|nr:hypothetical protein [Luteibacter pinisoli]QDE39183.1 hypothetical protein FIV34_08205 [Luteibacter pinisoli]